VSKNEGRNDNDLLSYPINPLKEDYCNYILFTACFVVKETEGWCQYETVAHVLLRLAN